MLGITKQREKVLPQYRFWFENCTPMSFIGTSTYRLSPRDPDRAIVIQMTWDFSLCLICHREAKGQISGSICKGKSGFCKPIPFGPCE